MPHAPPDGVDIADVWAYVYDFDQSFDDHYVPVHWTTLAYEKAHTGTGELRGLVYSVLFELGSDDRKRSTRYMNIGGESSTWACLL